GSTVIGLVGGSERCAFVWAGDSRLYRFRDNTLKQLTQDHCENEEQPLSSWSIKNANIITRAVGADDDLVLDMAILEVLAGDAFLLCSDGLDKEMSFNEIERVLQVNPYHDIADALVNEVLARGARDNVTVIVVVRTNAK
ncbi:MAG: SpoIIE family protein phosphatase, partial [Methylococcaceae bacterium]|nr:SpoIIE family protein phosphatase [Methylococcaceae bacterium]